MMNRREAIKNAALLLGVTFSAPTWMAMSSQENKTGKKTDFLLSDPHQLIIAEVAEMIIPRTSTPGAKDAGVPAFIVMMIQDCYRQPEHISFVEGLNNLEQKNFMSLNPAQKTEILKQVELNTVDQMKVYQVQQTKMGDNDDREQMNALAKGLPFWRLMKEMTLLGYYTSEAGLKSSFDYTPVPGKLEMIKLKPDQKSYAY